MSSKTHLTTRLASLVVLLALVTVGTVSVCPALGGSLVSDAHRCCKTPGHSTPSSDESGCRAKCAGSSTEAITPVGLIFGPSLGDQIAPVLTAAEAPVPDIERSIVPAVRTAGPPHPLYERNSALLI